MLNTEFPYYPATPLWGIDSKELKTGSQAQCSQQHYSQHPEVETTQLPINRWMDKQKVEYVYNGTLLNLHKEWNSDTR